MNVHFKVPVKPIGVNETYRVVRFGKRSGLAKSVAAKAYQEAIQHFARRAMQGRNPYARPVEVSLLFAFRTARSDIDGPLKSTLDAMNGIVYLDDAQVQRLVINRCVDRGRPHVDISVRSHISDMALESGTRDYRGTSAWEDAYLESPIPDKV